MIIENPGQVAKHIHVRFGFYYPCIITSQRSERASKTGPLYCLSSPVGALDVCMPLRKSRGWTRRDRKQNGRGRSNAHHIAYHFIPFHSIPSSMAYQPPTLPPSTTDHPLPPTPNPSPTPTPTHSNPKSNRFCNLLSLALRYAMCRKRSGG